MDFHGLLSLALQKANKQESLATSLDLSPSALSKRINGEVGWSIHEIDGLLKFTGCEIADREAVSRKIEILKEAMKIMVTGE